MPVACHFQCGDDATTWNWSTAGTEGHAARIRDVTVYTCPRCGIYGLTGPLESRLRGTEPEDRKIEKQFLLLHEELLKRRPNEAPPGSALVGVISLQENDSELELAFITPKE